MSGVAQDETTPTGTGDEGAPPTHGAGLPDRDAREAQSTVEVEGGAVRPHLRLVADNSEPRSLTADADEPDRSDALDGSVERPGVRTGVWLRSTRENLGYSLEQVSRETRIRQDHLRAIEDMMPHLVGAKVYVEGHIRTYARHLGLPAEEVLSQYRRESAILSDPEKQEIAPPPAPRKFKPSAPVLGLVVVGLVGAGAAALLMNMPGEEPTTRAPAVTADPATTAPAVTAPPLRIVAVKPARIEIRGADGTKFIGREFHAGETYAPRVGAGWTVSTEQGDAFEWRLGETLTLGLFAPQGGPVNYMSVDLALQRQPVAINPTVEAVTTPSPTEANQTVTTPAASPRRAPRPAQPEPSAAPTPVDAPTPVNDPALAAYPDTAPPPASVPPSAQ